MDKAARRKYYDKEHKDIAMVYGHDMTPGTVALIRGYAGTFSRDRKIILEHLMGEIEPKLSVVSHFQARLNYWKTYTPKNPLGSAKKEKRLAHLTENLSTIIKKVNDRQFVLRLIKGFTDAQWIDITKHLKYDRVL